MSENPTRRQFSAEFERDAVDLTQQPGRTSTDVAHQLGFDPPCFSAGDRRRVPVES